MRARIPAITVEQQTAIALDPALALAPVPPGVVVTPPAPAPSESPGRPTARPTETGMSGPADPAQQRQAIAFDRTIALTGR